MPKCVESANRGVSRARSRQARRYLGDVGTLKSYNVRNGYGFLECRQAKQDWGVDVFIHKNNVPTPWLLGQPVEFAVQVNTRGQPQAYDCLWLPRLPPQGNKVTPGTVPALPGAGPYSAGSSSSTALALVDERKPPQPKVPKMSDEPRRLGTLKSFSQTHGYGFVECGETKACYSRDVYLDKTQMRENSAWQWGQLLEFSVSVNDRGNPQAQNVNWEPVPIMSGSPSSVPAWKRTYNEKTVDQLKRLLKLLYEKNPETAIVSAIDLQGGSSGPGSAAQPAPEAPPDADVDYVFFVLDRLENKEEVLGAIKDFVKMLFILMLSRMLRSMVHFFRLFGTDCQPQALAQAIQTNSEPVKQHFQVAEGEACCSFDLDVVKQINTHIQNAAKDNDNLQNEATLSLGEVVSDWHGLQLATMARRVMSLMLLAAAVVAFCRSTAFVSAPKTTPRADVLAALAPMVLGAQVVQPAFAEADLPYNGNFDNPTYYEESTSSDLSYLLFFTAALLVYLGKTAFDKSGAKSLGDAVSK
ncbi:unnamed protein product [Symbiodinium sp. CCMP2592]|nr:unnamed protein product [Symbiodinium sp. CCMP2592]